MADNNESISPGLQISVTPSQAAFFAGEPLTVTITITNTHTPPPIPSGSKNVALSDSRDSGTPVSVSNKTHARSQSAALASGRHSHKRSAHSVSSVPIAHPPTSPGLGQFRHSLSGSFSGTSPLLAQNLLSEGTREIRRRGLIGKGIQSAKVVNGEVNGANWEGQNGGFTSESSQNRSAGLINGKNAIYRGVRDEIYSLGMSILVCPYYSIPFVSGG
jgi:hypothetical protein